MDEAERLFLKLMPFVLREIIDGILQRKKLKAALASKEAVIRRQATLVVQQQKELARLRPVAVRLIFVVFLGGLLAVAYIGSKTQA